MKMLMAVNQKRSWRDVLRSKYHAAVAAAFGVLAVQSAYAYDLGDFGLDTLVTSVIALVLLGYVAVSAAVGLGVGAESIFGIMIRWTKRAFGGR